MSRNLKGQSLRLRARGFSYGEISKRLLVSPSTLSGWLRDVRISDSAKERLTHIRSQALSKARNKAADIRLKKTSLIRERFHEEIQQRVKYVLDQKVTQEIILAALYLGDGFKKRSLLGFGNTNPSILSMFVYLLRATYGVRLSSLKCDLYLRWDQDARKETRYWSRILRVPASHFRKPQFDQRTLGKKSYKDYHGVCAVYCYNAEAEKRLTAAQQVLLHSFLGG